MKKDNQIIDEMKRKFLTIDIKMFVEKSFIVDPDTANEFREKISLFLMNHYSIDDFNSLDDNSKELYRLFLDSPIYLNQNTLGLKTIIRIPK